jgi:LmbE family N-acetylglucosaminyl deacetylase
VAVVAHPDDDTFGCSGSVALHADDPDFRFALVHVTSGEHGQIADPALATRDTLGAVREEEDRRSWVALGREPDRHEFLRYPDGGVAGVPFEGLVARIAEVLRDERPDVVITFGPDGITGHPDHITTGRATTDAFHQVLGENETVGPRRLLHSCLPASAMLAFNEVLVSMGQEPVDLADPKLYQPRGVPDDTVKMVVDCSAVLDAKAAALLAHRTQANDMANVPDDVRREILRLESHVIAWPAPVPDATVLGDLFEGLT